MFLYKAELFFSVAAGFGLFHWLLLLACGWANASDAVEILCVSFLLPTARCDLLLSSADMGLLTASIFLGGSVKQPIVYSDSNLLVEVKVKGKPLGF